MPRQRPLALSIRFSTACSVAMATCLSLAVVWVIAPERLLDLWAVDASPGTLVVARRSGALFLGLAWLMHALAGAPPSPLRTAAADGMALACAVLAMLGIAERLAAHAGPGILAASCVEIVLAVVLAVTVRREHASPVGEPRACEPPAGSRIAALAEGAYFQDAWTIVAADPSRDALGQFLASVRDAPGWVDAAMTLRNRVVALVGLKDLGRLSAVDAGLRTGTCLPGTRVGIFSVRACDADEVLLEDRDAHLDVVVSIHCRAPRPSGLTHVTVTTVVHIHNALGRLYMLPVRPAHRIIVTTLLRRIGSRSCAE